jgi:hypothetical protein
MVVDGTWFLTYDTFAPGAVAKRWQLLLMMRLSGSFSSQYQIEG